MLFSIVEILYYEFYKGRVLKMLGNYYYIFYIYSCEYNVQLFFLINR